jgi:hypothetical protein
MGNEPAPRDCFASLAMTALFRLVGIEEEEDGVVREML